MLTNTSSLSLPSLSVFTADCPIGYIKHSTTLNSGQVRCLNVVKKKKKKNIKIPGKLSIENICPYLLGDEHIERKSLWCSLSSPHISDVVCLSCEAEACSCKI